MDNVIYDFGANRGQDIPYYLLKADLVVAVEANKDLCDKMAFSFRQAIEDRRLIILNRALYAPTHGEDMPDYVDLHIPRQDCKAGLGDAHATIVRPETIEQPFFSDPKEYEAVRVQAATPLEIVSEFGPPLYIKIDVEHYDHYVVRSLFDGKIFPKYISSECHNAEVLGLMLACDMYEEYKLVVGSRVGEDYSSTCIRIEAGSRCNLAPADLFVGIDFPSESGSLRAVNLMGEYCFSTGSSGPFGEDIFGEWKNANAIFGDLSATGLGWVDIHARRKS